MRNVFFKQSANAIMLLAFATGSVMTSCSGKTDDPAPVVTNDKKTITQIVVDSPNFSFLKAAVVKAGLDGALGADPATLTVFAPTNDAFKAAGFATEAAVTAAPKADLENILKNHVLPDNRTAASLTNGSVITNNLAAKPLTVSVAAGVVTINDAKVTSADLVAKNGRIHTVDKVILPRTSILVAAVGNPNLSALTAAVVNVSKNTSTNVAALLNGPTATKFTVFAPSNAAFLAANPAFTSTFLGDAANATAVLEILKYHVIPGAILAAAVPGTPNAEVTTFDGTRKLYTTNNANGVFINGIRVVTADLAADNGVVHVVEKALIPASVTLAGFVTADNRFSRLLAAIQYADANTPAGGLAALLSGTANSPFTVFAPVNSAFDFLDANTNGTIETSELAAVGGPALTAIIQRHVVVGKRLFAADLANGSLTTANGNIILGITAAGVTITTTTPTPTTATVAVTNVLATNGVAHAITQVLL